MEQFQVVGADGPLVVGAGEDVILPCSLKPNISAVDMTVEWFRLHTSDSLVHLYENGVDNNKNQIKSYRGRTSLFKEELQKGNASLKLSRVKVTDEGKYKCFIQSKSRQDDTIVQVIVEALGTYPVISIEDFSSFEGLSLLCEIKGWNPEPEVLWLDSDGNLLPADDTETLRDTERFHVKKRVTVQDSNTNRFYCRVILRDHMKETEIVISSNIFDTWRTQVIWTVVLVLVIAIGLIVSCWAFPRYKENKRIIDEEFNRTRRKYAKDVTLDPDTANPNLIVSDDEKQVKFGQRKQDLPDNPRRFNMFYTLGKEGFSSGRFYYEVQVNGKTEWALGVATKSVDRRSDNKPRPEKGYWILSMRDGKEYKPLVDPRVLLSLKRKPQKVGVFVDYEEGVVSFYDVETKSHICSFTDQSFTEEIYPYFSPGISYQVINSAPLIITTVSRK
ncbi:butyrophilin subfamily 1 member A1-like [Chanos chanos]|uniref:Butyrophilin subfamily 1 member A1-like n=1 Tax=Chanos chanos TaxID=29144 RepID=A0A6J2VT97_CHACN|nr:butyrophilin subfamily 1 member A1-like [Chanos chanos]